MARRSYLQLPVRQSSAATLTVVLRQESTHRNPDEVPMMERHQKDSWQLLCLSEIHLRETHIQARRYINRKRKEKVK